MNLWITGSGSVCKDTKKISQDHRHRWENCVNLLNPIIEDGTSSQDRSHCDRLWRVHNQSIVRILIVSALIKWVRRCLKVCVCREMLSAWISYFTVSFSKFEWKFAENARTDFFQRLSWRALHWPNDSVQVRKPSDLVFDTRCLTFP